ncbi:terminase family protein [Altererythrobacter arenosus]|uniref:Terminase family protein n=1 Tax=Altererythrobacter arenosus TaxID=3032592 RepID=A0ABY8G063_9SPHN|nr:terminase family protein [Altererythrobacter sp. CAU 1644]WFL79036.1 terminase family protein [Altererythrobacter sp. CAU 1644]
MAKLGQDERNEWESYFLNTAHPGQLPPDGDWLVWLLMAGRGFGKTRAGAEWVRMVAENNERARIALVAASLAEARSVMVEGESGLIACSPEERRPVFEPSLHRLRWPNGAQAYLYSAAEPESLRGPQHSHAWCDEIGKWPLSHERASRCWDNLLLGLRLGEDQRIVATTTPRNVPLVKRLLDSKDTRVTGGATHENHANLPRSFIDAVEREFGDTQLGRQELLGELIADVEGALWHRALLEQCRETAAAASDHLRVVVAVDPPASARGDACGIVVAALGGDGIARVLADCSVEQASPETWARAVAQAADSWQADRVVAEANQGGAMVASVLRAADVSLPLKLVHARRGKVARAEPVAALYEAGRVKHCGMFARLEDQLCGLMAGGAYEGPGRSPDRADALVWALSELMLSRRGAPRVTQI